MPQHDNPNAVQVIKTFTESFIDMAEDIANTLTRLTAQADQIMHQRESDLCRWGDDGGYCP